MADSKSQIKIRFRIVRSAIDPGSQAVPAETDRMKRVSGSS
jgi:hypothetical protein